MSPKNCTAGQVYQHFPGKMAPTQPRILSLGEREGEEWLPSAGVSPASFFWGRNSACLLPVRHHLLLQWQLPGWRRRDGTLTGDRLPSLWGSGLSTEATVLRTGHPTSHRSCDYRTFKASLSISQVGGRAWPSAPVPSEPPRARSTKCWPFYSVSTARILTTSGLKPHLHPD